MDTQNVVEQLSEEQLKKLGLVVGEGTYTIRESVLIAMPPPHPSETPSQAPNPLDTAKKPPTTGTRLSLAIVGPKGVALAQQFKEQILLSTRPPTPEIENFPEIGGDQSQAESNNLSQKDTFSFDESSLDTPAFGSDNPALIPQFSVKEAREAAAQKKKKPKNSMIKTNSSFVSRVYPADSLGKKLSERDPNGIFAFANINRAFHWMDLSTIQKVKGESLTKVLFAKAQALCHDINAFTSTSPAHIDLIMGFSTGDLLWYEPTSQKYARINKNGIINDSPVFDVKWMPGHSNYVLTAHADGTLVVFDKDKEDAPFLPEDTPTANKPLDSQNPFLKVLKSVKSQNQKTNPVAFWKIHNSKINAIAFSPDGKTLAVVSEEGRLRLIDIHNEKLTDVFNGYVGPLYCVCWSPDGNYILTGGQDADLISIYSFVEKRLVARFKGHKNWVRWIAFDPWRCDERNYRFGSVGDDCQLCLWDFNLGMVHTPRSITTLQRNSMVSARDEESQSFSDNGEGQAVIHSTVVNVGVPFQPLVAQSVDDHQMSWVGFQEDCIITSCRRGHVRVWDRPKENSH